ncbi:SCP-2 sterol transfer family protein [Hasllibacter halocynthiae]|uniref:SCP-2 sterol transfer family protein n=1 Tax=Hasllibacter halocynthiae TaxID=595589 RepID=A0A2T0X715_9RHOB|nr:SCP2 sterol-binding domain-containing protein [Hasllibacter halocynthiae]PRY94751.1 SCP-2 sterol transfer family protein [Hasllibacter halocynthiae]
MSQVIDEAVRKLNAKLDGGFDGSAKFVIEDEGAIMLDQQGAREAADAGEDADVTMTADAETFRAILEGDMNPTSAFMTGKLKVDGSMGEAMKLGSALS